jgi:hypothetical protein
VSSNESTSESTYERELAEGEPSEPTSVVIETADGRRVVCQVTQKDRSTWIARPPKLHQYREGDRFLIDRLPAGGAIEFEPREEDWSGRAATRPAT